MPLYAYRCNNCGVQIERKQGFNDDPLKKCPECGEYELRKLYSPVGILFRGPGFYATDHRSSSGANGANKKPEKSDSEKSESKAKSDTRAEKSESSAKTTEQSEE